ncbi:MAG: HAD family hydrolase [Acidovorax sp. 17-64-282]|nr:MAG: HAD family hydrolase [Acidovorax sp. 17-64-282]
MRPLTEWPAPVPGQLLGILTDIDDTLTTDGAITPDALQALGALKASGLHVIPITGRPVGWSEPFAATWPVDAIVAENGAVALQRSADVFDQNSPLPNHSKREQLSKIYQQDAATRAANYANMQQVLAATVSSIHINGWFGAHNKLEGARWIVRELFGRDLDAEIDRWVYVGDSTNDQVMFEHFPHSVGVANIARFVPQLTHRPRFVTQGERGAGFAEVARAVLATR